MENDYDMVYVTNLPSFYKIRLWNEIARHKSLLVIFTGWDENLARNDDFFKGEKKFDSITLPDRNLKGIKAIRRTLRYISYKELVIAGNNTLVYWYLALTRSRSKNSGVSESSIYESGTSGIKGFIKRLFVSRFSRYYVCGEPHAACVKALGFKGEIIKTHGVGIFNYHEQPEFTPCSSECNRLLFVGRLSPEKNLDSLIRVVNRHPNWRLTIVGFGPQENELKSLAGGNVDFLGAINNEDLAEIYRAHDAFVLPSTYEPWGLVVEEALNNGIPVALSERVGSKDDWAADGRFGVTFSPFDEADIDAGIAKILTPEVNNRMRKNITEINFAEIEQKQVSCYL